MCIRDSLISIVQEIRNLNPDAQIILVGYTNPCLLYTSVAFAFLQPYLPGQADPNLCAVDPATGIQYRNIAPGEKGFIWGSNSIGQDLWALSLIHI